MESNFIWVLLLVGLIAQAYVNVIHLLFKGDVKFSWVYDSVADWANLVIARVIVSGVQLSVYTDGDN